MLWFKKSKKATSTQSLFPNKIAIVAFNTLDSSEYASISTFGSSEKVCYKLILWPKISCTGTK